MGYSIYIKTTKEKAAMLEKVIDEWLFDPIVQSNPVFEYLGICYTSDILAYGGKLPDGADVFGINYGDFDAAHALMYHVATFLKRKRYWYDGIETMKVSTPWWRTDPKKWSKFRKSTFALFYKQYRVIDKALFELDKKLKSK